MSATIRVGFSAVVGSMLLAVLMPVVADAQQVTIGTPFNTASDSFYENFGTSWGLRGKNFFFQQGGGPLTAAPQFGGFDPSSGLSGGWAFNGGDLAGNFNFNWSQGSRQSLVSQTPMVTLMNGQQAYFSDTSQSPFVIGQIPVVGGFPTLNYGYPGGSASVYPMYGPGPAMPVVNPLNHRVEQFVAQQQAEKRHEAERREQIERGAQHVGRFNPNQARPPAAAPARPPRRDPPAPGGDDLNLVGPGGEAGQADATAAARLAAARSSSAGRAVPSVAEARRLHQAEQKTTGGEALALFERGRAAEEGGKPNVAVIYYRMAVKQAAGPLHNEIQQRLDQLTSPGTP